jgi:hypothetical protein
MPEAVVILGRMELGGPVAQVATREASSSTAADNILQLPGSGAIVPPVRPRVARYQNGLDQLEVKDDILECGIRTFTPSTFWKSPATRRNSLRVTTRRCCS